MLKLKIKDKRRKKPPHKQESDSTKPQSDYWSTLSIDQIVDEFKVTEMKSKAKELGLSGYSRMKELDLAKLIFDSF